MDESSTFESNVTRTTPKKSGSKKRKRPNPRKVYQSPLPKDPNALEITDLPPDLLEEVLSYVPRKSDVGRARLVCRKFNTAGANVLRDSYQQLQVTLRKDKATVRQRFNDLLHEVPESLNELLSPKEFMCRRVVCRCVHHIETLASCLDQVVATIWSHNASGFCCIYDGDLLDKFRRSRRRILTAARLQTTIKQQPLDLGVRICREAAARFIWQFVYHVEQKTMTAEERRVADVVSAVSLLNTLCQYQNSTLSKRRLTRYKSAAGEPTGLVHVSVVCTLRNCWLGHNATAAFARKPPEERVVPAMRVLRELAWIKNGEHNYSVWGKLMRQCGVMELKQVPPCAVVLLGEGVVRDVGNHGRWFDATDLDAERVYFYGLRSRAKVLLNENPRITCKRRKQRVQLADKTVTIPTGFKSAVLDVKFEIKCLETQLPEDLVLKARLGEATLKNGAGWPSFSLKIESHSDKRRMSTWRCTFDCHRNAVRRRSVEEGVAGVKRRRFEGKRSGEPKSKRAKMGRVAGGVRDRTPNI